MPFDNLIEYRDYFIEGQLATVVAETQGVPVYLEEPVQYLHEEKVIKQWFGILEKVRAEQWGVCLETEGS